MTNDRQQRAARAEQMRKDREKADRKQRNLITVGIVVVVVALVALGGYAVKSASDDNKESDTLVAPTAVADDGSFLYTAEDAGGEPPADDAEPVTVTLTEDFQCPACQSFEAQSGPFLEDLVKKGEIEIKYQPISFLDRASANEYSSRALNAALCALDEGGIQSYKKVHDLLYANQPAEGSTGPNNAALISTLEQAGVTGVDTCVTTKKFGPWIEKQYDELVDAGFSGTPWIRIDGKDVEDGSPASLQKAIDAAKA